MFSRRHFAFAWLLLMAIASPARGYALGQPRFVNHTASTGSFTVAASGRTATLYVDHEDFPGVVRAAQDLQADVERVTGLKPGFISNSDAVSGTVILIGTISKSRLIDRLIKEHKLNVETIKGKWESSIIQVIDKPIPGVDRALVIAGSDKRGTIFGIYDLSEQIGVSPWYWWADVPITHKDSLYVQAGRYVQGEPAVKYRGIFLNDEAPALTGWVNANYGGYNHKFYEKVFELLLRLRANYLWPAMWGSAFNEDDPENARLADEYGIVMGTSHHEPMLRAQQEWKRHGTGPWDYSANSEVLNKFWSEGIDHNKNFESTITLGMRGDGDMPMTEGANITLLETIVAYQRKIIADHSTPTLKTDPQVWALYKEVQQYYEKGMRVPDDVTLLWCDDNWGNIRRLPTVEERKRSGGAGIYYHFDYVGDPRNYKWINTNPIEKVWEQMNLALNYGADRIWIVNVGDLKPMEFPIEYFLTLARNPERWGKDQTLEFTRQWAAREFGEDHANEIAELMDTYTRYNGRRKPELLDVDTFSLINYREADRVENDWRALLAKAEGVQKQLPENEKDAYFELILHPIKASAIVNELYISAGRNRLYATQGRADANDFAIQARSLFKADAELTSEYNHLLAHGKWNHMMDQTHLGYTYWQEPPLNVMPAVVEVQPAAEARIGVIAEGAPDAIGVQYLSFDNFQRQTHFIDIFNHGLTPFHYSASTNSPWITLNETSGEVEKERRVEVSIDWAKINSGEQEGKIIVTQQNGPSAVVNVQATRSQTPSPESLNGFVESDGYVSIEAEHFTHVTSAGAVHWDRIPGYGATFSGMTIFPVTAPSVAASQATAALQYRMYFFDSGTLNLETTLGPTLNFVPGRGLRFAVWFDDQLPQVVDSLEHNSESDWAKAVSDGVRRVETKLNITQPGYHTLNFGMVDPGIVLEKFVVSAGSIKPSYLGPPESFHNFPMNTDAAQK
ncbi:glycosyl hydrolase 115 family protein [Acidicapsa ligni]|uniref:glycosyl hydrolase 115 family protein n=1 Tax=Acidicapsa ligni TaxID=542300 RepID=UPI0021DFF363|nr:glycosyl hydrolase 115 family protein [Acidicapsa ligni]